MMQKSLCLFVTFLTFLFFSTGCSSTSKSVKTARQTVQASYELQKPIMTDNTAKNINKRPEWVASKSYSEKDGNMYFTGGFTNGSDYAFTIRAANAEATKLVAQSIGNFIRVEFTSFTQGSNQDGDVNRYIQDGVAFFIDKLQVNGIKQKEIYYEELFSPTQMKPTYNVFVMLELPRSDYMTAKAEMLRRLRDKFSNTGNTQAKEKAEELLDELKELIEGAIQGA